MKIDGMTRRSVLAGAGAAALAGQAMAATPAPFFQRTGLPIGIQLYTVAAPLRADLDGTLGALARIGYRTVELAGYAGKTPSELRAALDRAGLKCTSAHIPGRAAAPAPALDGDLNQIAEDAHVLGFDTVILPSFNWPSTVDAAARPGESGAQRLTRLTAQMTADGWKAGAEEMNRRAAALKALGLKFGYHNHSPEFAPVTGAGGATGYDLLIRHTDPALVSFELDAGWASAAGVDPVALMRAHPGRFSAMHVKDVGKGTKPNFELRQEAAEVGHGTVDWPRVLPAAYTEGVRRFFYEQEPPFTKPPLESAKISFDYLSTLSA